MPKYGPVSLSPPLYLCLRIFPHPLSYWHEMRVSTILDCTHAIAEIFIC